MLRKFSLKNFKNFKDELVLDLSKVNNYEFSTKAIRNKIVKTALIYGENASIKGRSLKFWRSCSNALVKYLPYEKTPGMRGS